MPLFLLEKVGHSRYPGPSPTCMGLRLCIEPPLSDFLFRLLVPRRGISTLSSHSRVRWDPLTRRCLPDQQIFRRGERTLFVGHSPPPLRSAREGERK